MPYHRKNHFLCYLKNSNFFSQEILSNQCIKENEIKMAKLPYNLDKKNRHFSREKRHNLFADLPSYPDNRFMTSSFLSYIIATEILIAL